MAKKFPFIPSLVCLCAFLILCCLGVWQIKRLEWKNNLQAELDTAFSKPSTKLNFDDMRRDEIRRGNVTGIPDMSKAIILHGRVYDGRAIQSLVVPFQTEGKIISLEVGCGESIGLDNFLNIKPNESFQIKVVARVPSWSYFTPQNNPDKGDWWRLDAQELANYWGYLLVSPFYMTQEDVYFVESGLTACPIQKKLRNDHLSYAIFWFTMALILAIIWGIRFLRPYIRG